MAITATNRNGSIIVTCLSPTKRRFEADGYIAVRDLKPRADRFTYEGQIGQGILGIYDPADSWWFTKGPRWVVQEAECHLANDDEARRFLVQSRDVMDWVYTPDGLVIGFGRDPSRGNQYSVDVFQIYINGRKPQSLVGARPDRIRVSRR